MESLTEDLQLKAIFTRGRDDRQRTTHPAPSAPLMRGTWIRDRLIGRSPFGSVWLENHKDPSRTVAIRAVKQIPKTSFRNLIERELQAMAKFSREPPFITCYGWYDNETHLFIAMEYCEYGDLSQYLADRGPLDVITARSITQQVLEGLVSMHQSNYAHRDLKPANLLVTKIKPLTVKITDFGFSKETQGQSGYSTLLGTPGFLPPEILEIGFGNHQGKQDISPFPVDMWCLGETLAHILTNKPCFDDPSIFQNYQAGEIPFPTKAFLRENVTAEAIDFVGLLMRIEPSDRMTAQEATEHRWMKDASGKGVNPTASRRDEPSSALTVAREPVNRGVTSQPTSGGAQVKQTGTSQGDKSLWQSFHEAVSRAFSPASDDPQLYLPSPQRTRGRGNDKKPVPRVGTSTSAFHDLSSSSSWPSPTRETSPPRTSGWGNDEKPIISVGTTTSAFDDDSPSPTTSPVKEPSPIKEASPAEEWSWSKEVSDGTERFHDYLAGDSHGSTGFYGSGTFD